MVLSKVDERTPEEQALVARFYHWMQAARNSTNYHDFEAANHLHNLACELSLPQPGPQWAWLIRCAREIEWAKVSKPYRAVFQEIAQKLLEEIGDVK